MTVNELIERLQTIEKKDKVCILSFDGEGWSNIEDVQECGQIWIHAEQSPVFSNN